MLRAGLDPLPAEAISLLPSDVLAGLPTVPNPSGLISVSPRAGLSATPESVRRLVDRPHVPLGDFGKAHDSPEVGPVVLDAPQCPGDEVGLGIVRNPIEQHEPVKLGHAVFMGSAKHRRPDILTDRRSEGDHPEQERMIPKPVHRGWAVVAALGVVVLLDEVFALMKAYGSHLEITALGGVELAFGGLGRRKEIGGAHADSGSTV